MIVAALADHQIGVRATSKPQFTPQQTPVPEAVPADLRELFQDISQRLPEVWPTLTNRQQKDLLRSLIQQVIVRRPTRDSVTIRIVWLSGAYTDRTTLTPIHRDRDVSKYDQLVVRVEHLWQQGYNDEQIAEQLTGEGYHSARSDHVTPKSVMKIRLAQKWYAPFERYRGADAVGNDLTVNGFAKRLAVNESTIYRFIYRKIIPVEAVRREPQSGIYLIRNDDTLIAQLLERIAADKRRKGMRQAASFE